MEAPGDRRDPYRDRLKFQLPDGQHVILRPAETSDENLLRHFFSRMSASDLRSRFLTTVPPRNGPLTTQLIQSLKKGSIGLLALGGDGEDVWGIGQLHPDSTGRSSEFAVLVRSDMKGRGIGWALLNQLLECARRRDISLVTGLVLMENTTMLKMCRELGFTTEPLSVASHVASVRICTKPLGNR
jgi:acetyltransferase